VRAGELPAQVMQDRKAQAADHDRQHDGDEDEDVGRMAHQPVCVDRESRVVESGHGVEESAPGGIGPGQLVSGAQTQHQGQRHKQLDDQGHDQHELGHAGHVADTDGVCFSLRGEPRAQAERSVDHEPEQRGGRHHAEATDLEQRHDHPLPERRPVGARIHRHQAGHAYCRYRGKQSGKPRRCDGICASDRQHQQPGSDQDRDQERERDDTGRVLDLANLQFAPSFESCCGAENSAHRVRIIRPAGVNCLGQNLCKLAGSGLSFVRL
jgi:hypothetical protein